MLFPVSRVQLHLYLFPADQLWWKHADGTLRFSQDGHLSFSSRPSSSLASITQHQVCVCVGWNVCVCMYGHREVTSAQITSLAVNLKAPTKQTHLEHIWAFFLTVWFTRRWNEVLRNTCLSYPTIPPAREWCGYGPLHFHVCEIHQGANWAAYLARLRIPLVLIVDMPHGGR